MADSNPLSTLLQAGNLGLIVLGWIVLNLQNNKRERRKEFRQAIDRLVDQLNDLEAAVIGFHRSVAHSQEASTAILGALQTLGRRIQRLFPLPNSGHERLHEALTELRVSITLDYFDATTFRQLKANDEKMLRVGRAARDLEDELEAAYEDRFLSRQERTSGRSIATRPLHRY